MEELSIKIKIADREYPMKVKRNEEERVRAAGKLINEKLKSYREQFGLDDKQDLLAMTAVGASDHIRRNLLVSVPQMGLSVRVIDGGGNVKALTHVG